MIWTLPALVAVLTVSQGTLAITGPNIFKRTGCNANNCARAVTGTAGNVNGGGASRTSIAKADCSAYVRTTSTITPATITNTISTTTTSTTFSTSTSTTRVLAPYVPVKRGVAIDPYNEHGETKAGVQARQATNTKTIPAYASPCPDEAAYVSACSCFGITSTVVYATAPAPQTTVFQTQSVTDTAITTITTAVQATPTGKLVIQPAFGSNGQIFNEGEGYDHLIINRADQAKVGDTYVYDAERLFNANLNTWSIYETFSDWADYWFKATSNASEAITDFRLVDDGTGTRGRVYLVRDGVQQKWSGSNGRNHLYFGETVPAGFEETVLYLVYI